MAELYGTTKILGGQTSQLHGYAKGRQGYWVTVVGIVEDIKDQANSSSASPAFWWPELQSPEPDMSLVIRAKAFSGKFADEHGSK